MSDKIVFQSNRPTKTIELPSFPGSKVEIYSSLLVKDLIGLEKGDDVAMGFATIHKFIKSWNFTDAEDKDLEITKENTLNFSATDISFLMEQITNFANEEKKVLPAWAGLS